MLLVSSGSHLPVRHGCMLFFLKRVCALYINVLLFDVKFFSKKVREKVLCIGKNVIPLRCNTTLLHH